MDGETDPNGQGENPTESAPRDITSGMRAAMDRLERFVTRRRRLVLGVWIVLVVAAVPFAAQQTKHLTAGGFEVPGSGSEKVSEALKRFPGAVAGRSDGLETSTCGARPAFDGAADSSFPRPARISRTAAVAAARKAAGAP